MTLENWIVKRGPKNVARLLKVDPATVSQWKTKDCCPRPRFMVRIHELSKGKVTYKTMIENFVNAKK